MSARFVRVRSLESTEPGARFRLEREEDKQLIDLLEELVWPEQVNNPDANHIRETRDWLVLSTADARWLHAALSELLQETE